jgi:trigger factor
LCVQKIGAAKVKVTTEKLPRSLIALDIEIDTEQFTKGLNRAAQRISQKYNIPGFRKGKAPRFIVENYFGREMLVDEAREDVINKVFQEALKQEGITPIGNPSLVSEQFDEQPYSFRVTVPVSPTMVLSDYRGLRTSKPVAEIDDEIVERALAQRREKHVVLSELEELRPAQDGDQLSVELEAMVDGELLEPRAEGEPIKPSSLVLEKGQLVEGLYEGLLGAEVDNVRQIVSQMPADHNNEKIAGKEVSFTVKVLGIQARELPEWDELPTLEEFDGTLEELREKTRTDLIETAKTQAERTSVDDFIRQLVEGSTFDIPEALIEREADLMLKQQEQEYARYGVKPEQVYAYRNQQRADLVQELLPSAEERIKRSMALQELIVAEGLKVDDAEVDAQIEQNIGDSEDEEQRENMRKLLGEQFRSMMVEAAMDKKLREHMLLLASGSAPSQLEETVES